MEWLVENWFLVLVFSGMAATHLFGHAHARMPMAKRKPIVILRARPRRHLLNQVRGQEPSHEA